MGLTGEGPLPPYYFCWGLLELCVAPVLIRLSRCSESTTSMDRRSCPRTEGNLCAACLCRRQPQRTPPLLRCMNTFKYNFNIMSGVPRGLVCASKSLLGPTWEGHGRVVPKGAQYGWCFTVRPHSGLEVTRTRLGSMRKPGGLHLWRCFRNECGDGPLGAAHLFQFPDISGPSVFYRYNK